MKKILIRGLIILGVFSLWEGLIHLLNLPVYILPSPIKIALFIVNNISKLLYHLSFTLMEAVAGFMLALAIGFIIAIIFVYNKDMEKSLYPFAVALKVTPLLALAPILILWFGTGHISKIIAATTLCFFPILVNSIKGLHSVDRNALDLFKSLGATKKLIFLKLRIPHSLPYVFQGLKISTSLAIEGAIVAEFLGATKGIGYLIVVSSYHLNTVQTFAAIILSAIAGIVFFQVISFIEKKIVFWHSKQEI